MKSAGMTSMERVLKTLSHHEPDRVPFFLLFTMHGAKELGISIQEYFSSARNVIEGQLRLHKKFGGDCLYPFFYASLETEPFGGEVIFREDGPPNSGQPCIHNVEDIKTLAPPGINKSKSLQRVLETIKGLKEKVQHEVPIIGVVMSPFSLPVMQLGFEKYLDIMYFRKDLFEHLMQINESFCVEWANAQLEAGATAICYFDPVSSTTIIPRELYQRTGFEVARRTLSRIKGATATHFASGRCLPIADLVTQTGTAMIGGSAQEDIGQLKRSCGNKMTLLGNLNAIEMHRWTPEQAQSRVQDVIQKAARGGGFILSDNHGEIPFQISDEVLYAISDTVRTYGQYPILT